MKTFRTMNRRDRCEMNSRRMSELNADQSAQAWHNLAGAMRAMGEMDVPKFENLLSAIRAATIYGKKI